MSALVEIIRAGGFVMYPIVICSILTWVIALERFWGLQQARKNGNALLDRVSGLLEKGEKDRALEASVHSQAPIARVIEDLIKNSKMENIERRANRRRIELNQEYRKFLWILGTIGAATPFLGLFGTVVGILKAFKDMAASGDTGFAVVAAGISEALIATAAGIIVAVIAVALYNFLQVKASKISIESRVAIEEFLDLAKATKA